MCAQIHSFFTQIYHISSKMSLRDTLENEVLENEMLAKEMLAKSVRAYGTQALKKSKLAKAKKKPPAIPRAANWGWGHLPLPAKVMVVGVFSGLVSLTTPYWAYIKTDSFGLATFGLWHFCSRDICTSIHDNLVSGRSISGNTTAILHLIWISLNDQPDNTGVIRWQTCVVSSVLHSTNSMVIESFINRFLTLCVQQ